jgi:KDO2-lipid IV(A) lauroyltransferase
VLGEVVPPAALRERAVLAAYTAGWAVTRRAPEPVAYAVFDLLGVAAARLPLRGRARLRANLARAVPPEQLDAAVRAGMRSYLRYWCDAFRLPVWDQRRVVGRVTTVGEEPLRAALREGRGFVAALAHTGNWDHAGAWAAATGAPVTTVAERLRPEELYDRFVAYRAAAGIRVLPLTGGPAPLPALRAALREGGLVCLLCDRDLSASGVEVPLLGQPARLAAGPAVLALQSGAPLHPVTVRYLRRERGLGWGRHGIEITIHPRIPVPESGTTREKATAMMRAVADAFTGAVRAAPQDWHMLQRVFVADLPAATP